MPDPTTQPAAHGDVLTAISDGLVALLKEYYGRGPTQAKTYYHDDLVVCVLRGGFTRVEQTLLEGGRGAAEVVGVGAGRVDLHGVRAAAQHHGAQGADDDGLRARQREVEARLGEVVSFFVNTYGSELAEVISVTIDRWDGQEAAERIELHGEVAVVADRLQQRRGRGDLAQHREVERAGAAC